MLKIVTALATSGSLLVYTVSSVILVILNKLIIARFFFDYPTVILMFQMAACLFGIEIGRMVGLFKIGPYTFDKGKDILVPSMLYSLHMYFTLTALEGMSLPIYGTLKRLLPLAILLASSAMLGKPAPSKRALLGLLLVCAGASLSTTYEWMFDGWSIFYAFISVGLATTYMVMMERLSLTSQYSTLELIYLNAFNGLVFFLIADMIQDEIRDAFMYFLTSGSILFWWCLVGVVAFGVIMNVTFMYSICNVSALDTGVANSIKMAAQTCLTWLFSFFLLFDVMPTWYNVIGFGVTGLGAVVYWSERRKQGYTPLASNLPRKTVL